MSRRLNLKSTLYLFVFDLLLVGLALLLSSRLRVVLPFGKNSPPGTWDVPISVYVLGIAVWAITFAAFSIYSLRPVLSPAIEVFRIIEATTFAWLTLAGLLYFTYRMLSRLQYLYFLAFYLMIICTQRLALRGVARLRGKYRTDARHVLIVGTGDIAQEIAQMVEKHQWMGLELTGFVDDNHTDSDDSLRILGKLDDTPALIQQCDIHEVVIALSRQDSEHIRGFVHQLQTLPVNIRLVPDYFDMAFLRVNIESFSGLPLLSLKEPVLDPFQRSVKRVFDITLSLLGLIPALPLMGIMALLIRHDSPGPALFKQPRIGEGGHQFTMYKFRTMRLGAEAQQDQVTKLDDQGQVIYKNEDDPRVTRIGHWLRRTSLDEIPQLFNILRGEMSLVGPRPEMPWLVEKYEPWQRKRFEVPQGLTGWWQVNGRADKPMYLNTEDDLYYIRNYSVWMDIKILWMTFQSVVMRRGAY
jgi:exopolysaccharide biosynthesis polyprenyl glycosylphosphotransferase